ncbi:hypothetical protein [Butyrivibrio sp. LB2008]|uniref:hypothetical protein n=1 Tax=Butyrivibrio sp. LB2008 TaxID=1408305 RepID=UPI0004791007|nr:hypothetical protein [Butyrivibrio sp. LB2008]
MRLRIILSLILLIFTTSCGTVKTADNIEARQPYEDSEKEHKLYDQTFEAELVKGDGQIRVHNELEKDDNGHYTGLYTYIDIIKNDTVIDTLNTGIFLKSVTDMSFFDFDCDGKTDIVITGDAPKFLLCNATSDYHYHIFDDWSILNTIEKERGNDFSMDKLKSVLLRNNLSCDYSDSLSFDELIEMLENKEIEEKQEGTELDYGLYNELIESLKISMKRKSLELLCGVADKWDLGLLSEGSLSYYFEEEDMWYLQYDIDGDGVDELLLGTGNPDLKPDIWRSDDYICDLFTIRNRKLLHVFKGGCRYRYYLCENGIIENEAASGSSMDQSFYRYNNGELKFIEHIFDEPDYPDVNRHCYYYENKDCIARELTEKEYDEMRDELEHKYNKPTLQFHLFKEKQ